MPTTSEGFRYPSSGDAPNVPQYIQNLAQDVDSRMSRFNTYAVNWPSLTIAGTNNITTNTISVPAQSGAYTLIVNVGIEAMLQGATVPTLQLFVNNSLNGKFLFRGISASSPLTYSGQISRSFLISDGSATAVFARLDIPAGVTATTYADGSHSYVTVATVTG